MKDVALAAGVSHMTVSRVVNRDASVTAERAARVERAISHLGYQRNDLARHLRSKRQCTGTIGLVVDDIANPFYSALARAVEEEARQRNDLVLVGSTNDDACREQEVVAAFCARQVDGLIVVPVAGSQRFLRAQLALGTKVVCVDRPAEGLDVDTVVVDNRMSAEAAVRHLLDHGHRRIGYLGDREDVWTAQERHRGYLAALAVRGIRPESAYIKHGVRSPERARAAVRELLALGEPPSALFTGNGLMTIGAVGAIGDEKAEIALVGFDDFPLAERISPAVTVVAQDPIGMGASAANLLFSRIDGNQSPARSVIMPTRLITRGSGEIPGPQHRGVALSSRN
jgi:LacI family transcriptional regulator